MIASSNQPILSSKFVESMTWIMVIDSIQYFIRYSFTAKCQYELIISSWNLEPFKHSNKRFKFHYHFKHAPIKVLFWIMTKRKNKIQRIDFVVTKTPERKLNVIFIFILILIKFLPHLIHCSFNRCSQTTPQPISIYSFIQFYLNRYFRFGFIHAFLILKWFVCTVLVLIRIWHTGQAFLLCVSVDRRPELFKHNIRKEKNAQSSRTRLSIM